MGVFVYKATLGATITTNAAANTANDFAFVKPGAARTVSIKKIEVFGKGALLTTLSGIEFRLEMWTTTASSGGTAITPAPDDLRTPASSATCGISATTVTSGTGGPTVCAAFGCTATGPGGWVASDADEGYTMDAAVNKSMDLFNVSAGASATFGCTIKIQE